MSLQIPITEIEYRNALIDSDELGAKMALKEAGLIKPYLKLVYAKRLYGTQTVKRWIAEGLIKPIKDGDRNSSVRIDRIEIEAVAKSSNISSYMTTFERQNLK